MHMQDLKLSVNFKKANSQHKENIAYNISYYENKITKQNCGNIWKGWKISEFQESFTNIIQHV